MNAVQLQNMRFRYFDLHFRGNEQDHVSKKGHKPQQNHIFYVNEVNNVGAIKVYIHHGICMVIVKGHPHTTHIQFATC